jgi:hypothetical protein
MVTNKPEERGTTEQNADVLQYTNEQFTENIKITPFSFM